MTASENFDQQRLGATLRAFRAFRHEFATPLSAAMLHLELAKRAALRASVDIPENLRNSLETGRKQLEEAVLLLDGLSAIGAAREGEPGLLDFAALVQRLGRSLRVELETSGLLLEMRGPKEGVFVYAFEDEIERATRETILTAARWARPGPAVLEVAAPAPGFLAAFSLCVPLGDVRPGDRLFRARSRPGAGTGPSLARWTFEAHAGSVEGREEDGSLVVTASLPLVASR